MNQKGYITKVFDRFEMCNFKPRSTPSEEKLEFDGETLVDPRRYREAVGSLVHAMTCTRPDICWVVTKLSQFLAAPMKGHRVTLRHALRYLKGTLDFELCYRKCDDALALIGYSDADWASSIFEDNQGAIALSRTQSTNEGRNILMFDTISFACAQCRQDNH